MLYHLSAAIRNYGWYGCVSPFFLAILDLNYCILSVGDRPLAKVAEPEGSSKMVTFANHKESFFLL